MTEEVLLFRESKLFKSEVDIIKEIEGELGLKSTSRPDGFDFLGPFQFIAEDHRVKHITLHKYPFSFFLEAFIRLIFLETINFTSTELETLPESIGILNNLKTLSIDNGKLSDLPKSINNIDSITTLMLQNNQFTHIPDVITELKSLKYLYLSDNQLSSLPKTIGNLKSLKEINVSWN